MRFEGKVVVVTGAGSGFGEAFARRFAAEGAAVTVVDIDPAGGEAVAASIREGGGAAEFVHADVAAGADVEAAVAAVVGRHDRIDVLLNNAGVCPPRAALEATPESDWDRIFDINVKSLYHFARHAVPVMRAGGGGVIVNTASTAGLKPRNGLAAYAASKAAVIALTRAMAVELAPDRIRVNALAPVASDTPLFREMSRADEAFKAQVASMIPLGRLCDPGDMAACAAFLASDEAAFLTGACLPVDGGWTAG